ncbi:UDP-glucosyltransferase 2-like isoform X2 [Adelges cooleyi]|uniref:UDP-glucosyltransferase 2-like isoform X2 n=1 Tax=Adelges cooleyi TaxID=133065 RepID=UPI00217FC77F|nr:UDP-glucosyltransferase 2-like isoform X2 [Adelges cooleyi]
MKVWRLQPQVMLCVVVLSVCRPITTANVLSTVAMTGKSHWTYVRAVLRALTDGGHNVTVFTPFVDGDRENYTEIDVTPFLEYPVVVNVDAMTMLNRFDGVSNSVRSIMNFTKTYCKAVHRHPKWKDFATGRHQFDVVISEVYGSQCAAYYARLLNVPLIFISPTPLFTDLEPSIYGTASNPAIVSHQLTSFGGYPKTFQERFFNVLTYVHSAVFRWYVERTFDPQPYELVEPIVPSLVFLNTHFITEPARLLPPNAVQIGGIHLTRPRPIPSDILEFIENSASGVIVFTLGSIISVSTLPERIQRIIIEVLGQLPQRVLMKYEGNMNGKPGNVMTVKWLPQRDILVHPKVKLFISHGGISGLYEVVDAGVPVLGFPLFFDQPKNIANLVDAGMALSLDLLTMTESEFLNTVTQLINNDTYSSNAKAASDRFKDRPMSPAESVVYWTEYVLRHKGAPHLKSKALDLTWYQCMLLDVIGAIVAALLLISYLAFRQLKKVYKYFYGPIAKVHRE